VGHDIRTVKLDVVAVDYSRARWASGGE